MSLRLILGCLALIAAGCGDGAKPPAGSAPTKSAAATIEPTITVSVAASTKEAVEALAADFGRQTKAVVHVNAGPSSSLAQQILAGAPVDLFLSANRQWAEAVSEKGHVVSQQSLLTNKLVIVVPKGNPANIHSPADLTAVQVTHVALAGEKVPAGMYADQALAKLDLSDKLAAKIVRGQDVRTALAYVQRGEAEAGIVYSTDVSASSKVESVYEFDPNTHDEIMYVLVLLKRDRENPMAQKFYDYLISPEAAKTFREFGFQPTEAP